MKRIALLTLAFLLAPVAGFAQDAPPPGPPPAATSGGPNPQRFAEMRQDRAQFEQLHAQARSQMLAALTPAHRALLANVVGQLAIAPNPDPRAAAQQLDAVLSPGEKQSVLTIASQLHAQTRALMQAARARMEASLTPDQRAQLDAKAPQHENGPEGFRHQPDAGRALLHAVLHVGGHDGPRPPM